MPQLPKAVARERARRLRVKGHEALDRYLAGQAGVHTTVLIERDGMGRTPEFAEMVFGPCGAEHGALVDCKVTGVTDDRQLAGVLL